MLTKYEGAMMNGTMEGHGRATYHDKEASILVLDFFT